MVFLEEERSLDHSRGFDLSKEGEIFESFWRTWSFWRERDLWIILEEKRSLDHSGGLDLFRGGKIFGSF